MSDLSEIARLNGLLEDLQSQIAFQEQAITELSDTILRQQDDINRLQQEWALVQDRYANLREQLPETAIEKPPHY